MTQWFTWFGNVLIRICLLAMTAWASFAIYYSNLPVFLRPLMASIFAITSLVAIGGRHSTHRSRQEFLVFFAVVLVGWLLMPPSNNRNWQPDVVVLPWADIRGNTVTIHNIRNCDYRSETDYTVRHYDRTFDLARLKSIDLSLVHWGSPYIAHTMLSFGFEGGDRVCFSAETRKEIGESYSSIKGFFRQYELTYVVADERDLIGSNRRNHRARQGQDRNRPIDAPGQCTHGRLHPVFSAKVVRGRAPSCRSPLGNCQVGNCFTPASRQLVCSLCSPLIPHST